MKFWIFFSFVFFIPLVLHAESGVVSLQEGRVIGGDDVKSGNAPWAAAIFMKKNGKPICGGGLIDPNLIKENDFWRFESESNSWNQKESAPEWVLTAAHCFYTVDTRVRIPDTEFKKDYRIYTGNVKIKHPSGEEHEIEEIFISDNYDPISLDNDVALVKITSSSEKKRKISNSQRQSIRLAVARDKPWVIRPYTALHAYGWGRTTPNPDSSQPSYSNNLKVVRLPRVDKIYCREAYRGFGSDVGQSHFCSGYSSGEYDTCFGDSGTPIIFKPTSNHQELGRIDSFIVGITSTGPDKDRCAIPNGFGLYTDIYKVTTWIKRTLVSYYTNFSHGN